MARSDCFVSVVAPLDNDEDIVREFVEDVIAVLRREYTSYELVLVDDGSTDATVEHVSQTLPVHECIRLIRLSRRFGREEAIAAGLDSAIGDFVVVMTPESDPPELIPEIVERCRKAGCGVVSGVRTTRRGEPLYLRIGARLFSWYTHRIMKLDVPRDSTDFHAFNRQSVNAITRIKDRLRYLRTFSAWVGYGRATMPYEPIRRRPRPRSKSLGQAVNLAINLIVANSTHPLRVAAVLSGLSAAGSAVFAAVSLIRLIVGNEPRPAWAPLAVAAALAGTFLFATLAILCEYTGRLLSETQDRPLYFVLEERNSSVLIAHEARKNVVTDSTRET